MKLAKIVGGVATLVAIALGSAAATAQEADYPTKSVRVIVPFAAGGTADLVARVVADKLAERLGQTFIIENKPGAGGVIGRSEEQTSELQSLMHISYAGFGMKKQKKTH